MCLWGVAGLPSVDTLAEGDALSSLELTVGGEGACRTGFCHISPGIIRWGQESASDGTGCVGPGIIRQGRRACRTGLVASTPDLSVGGPVWLRLLGVAGSPSVDTLAEGDAPSSPELTVGADGDAVDWNALRGVTYGRRGGI